MRKSGDCFDLIDRTGYQASVPIPKFAHWRRTLMRTSESKGHWQLYASGALLNPKFAIGVPARLCELRVQGTSAGSAASISPRRGSYQAGSLSEDPNVALGSSMMKPGPSV